MGAMVTVTVELKHDYNLYHVVGQGALCSEFRREADVDIGAPKAFSGHKNHATPQIRRERWLSLASGVDWRCN